MMEKYDNRAFSGAKLALLCGDPRVARTPTLADASEPARAAPGDRG
jgi:hypothetical protein